MFTKLIEVDIYCWQVFERCLRGVRPAGLYSKLKLLLSTVPVGSLPTKVSCEDTTPVNIHIINNIVMRDSR